VNLQAYANHRKAQGLRGVSHVAVLNAINEGRLTAPAVRREGRSWIIDPTLADAQWSERTTQGSMGAMGVGKAYSQPYPSPDQVSQIKGVPPLAVSKGIKAAIEAQLAQLELQKAQEVLVYRDDYDRANMAALAQLKQRVERIAPLLRTRVPMLDITIFEEVERLAREALESVANYDYSELAE